MSPPSFRAYLTLLMLLACVCCWTCTLDPTITVYMGKDKFENELLIKYGWPEDVWFHVEHHSSAHVYLRMGPGMSWDNLPPVLVEECAQLTKANSIEGSKLSSVTVIYTPWTNLKKTRGMEDGEVGFHSEKLVKRVTVEKNRDILKRLEKTRVEKPSDGLQAAREDRDREERARARKEAEMKRHAEREEIERLRREAEERSYKSVMREENMRTNTDMPEDYEDSFM